MIEAKFFAHEGKSIVYAALSVDGRGLKSYGNFTMKLKDAAISQRASLLEDNSYFFFAKRGLTVYESDIPHGYRSTWENRHKLAVSKLSEKIKNTSEDEYGKILLSGDSDRNTDDFIEVHIYGGFTNMAIDSVSGCSKRGKRHEKSQFLVIKDKLKKTGREWVERDD
ncbi:MAG: hypothetical protein HQK88_05885 [Nitrospirae bacterium]|nr:hypothetical protein [Nitrospirota bacterium]MBF0520603.1 hypothetical protein [Nitrospirota bacterium]MBF0534624.1 hypothetical protein [Nitrospirota bacterium]MBF0616332.1 hypothetical protein [Nitrospirota bacterium]